MPFCVQLCLSKIKPNPEDKQTLDGKTMLENENFSDWGEDACRMFTRLARSDIPFFCEIVNQVAQ